MALDKDENGNGVPRYREETESNYVCVRSPLSKVPT
jgi:hypothetical protein